MPSVLDLTLEEDEEDRTASREKDTPWISRTREKTTSALSVAACVDLTFDVPVMIPTTSNHKKNDDDDDDDEVQVEFSIQGPLFATHDNDAAFRKKRKRGTFSCGICLEDDMEASLGYSLQRCGHRYCRDCLKQTVEATKPTLTAKLRPQVDCPHATCTKILTPLDIQYVFQRDRAAYASYAQAASLAYVETQVAVGGARRCPQERCNYTFCYEPGPYGCHFACPVCKASFCLDCKANGNQVGPAHESVSCVMQLEHLAHEKEAREKLEAWKVENAQADKRFRELLQEEEMSGLTMPCPKCKNRITKNGGCNDMSCRCGHHFIWKGR